jgi:hypothetical protein
MRGGYHRQVDEEASFEGPPDPPHVEFTGTAASWVSAQEKSRLPVKVKLRSGDVVDLDALAAGGPPKSKVPLIVLLALSTLIPATVLIINSVSMRSACQLTYQACEKKCRDDYATTLNEFGSQLRGEIDCVEKCGVKRVRCEAQTDTILLSAILLVVGFFVSVLLFLGLEVIIRRTNGTAAGTTKPRAAYSEPVYAEEEVKLALKGRKRKEAEAMPVVTMQCRDCRIPVEVDARWLTGEMRALQGSICPRCAQIIVGLL